jgi:uncharacterized membrane protein YdcZ (DUF606 family)
VYGPAEPGAQVRILLGDAVSASLPPQFPEGFGAIFIIAGIVLIPHLGAATFIALLVTGQMITAMAFDHFGLFGLAQRSADLPRLLGAALLVAGVILVRR